MSTPLVKPWEGEQGIVCLPTYRNLVTQDVERKHPDWKLVECPSCGAECYLSPEAAAVLDAHPHRLVGACTDCAIRMGGMAQGGVQ
jgi:hypothetical protein